MRAVFITAALSFVALPNAAQADSVDHPECESILPPTVLSAGQRSLVPEDLARLRDIGPSEPETFSAPFFTVSPDGRRAAFQLRRGDPQRNKYCLAMVIVDLDGKSPPRIVDEGGRPLLVTLDLRGMANLPLGVMQVVTPRWSSDGKWIAFLRSDGAATQVWRAFTDGSGSAKLTHSDVDIVDFRFGIDGSTIVYATRPGLEQQRQDNDRDGLNGWHYDDRFVPAVAKRPLPVAPAPRVATVLNLATGQISAARPQEAMLVAQDHQITANPGEPIALETDGLEILETTLRGGAKAGSFHAHRADGTIVTCTAEACEGALTAWWAPGRRHVRFQRWEGWGEASTAIYDWDLKSSSVHRLYLTDDVLTSCAPSAKDLICLVDSSLEPRRLVRLNPATGERRTLFDPNPEFKRLRLGKPERLHWRNAFGTETVADLVLPVGYRAGEKYPMVVVQYDTRGFLRGGTDDEYPIQAFANRGYVVLSFKRPSLLAAAAGAKNYDEAYRKILEQFGDRRSVQSSLETGVKIAIARGIADPKRLGITGLSDGSTTVEWALIHSSIFSAAAMSSCCWDSTGNAMWGPKTDRYFMKAGFPGILERDNPFWQEMSLADNARRIKTPILINASEEEFIDTMVTYSALREAGVPVDLFEYPGEYHARWQPAHRLATYRRSLDWFDFWLRGIRSTDPDRQSELKEWNRLKQEGGHGHPI